MADQDWITRHFEVGKMGGGNSPILKVLVCRHCGAFTWDTEKHIASLHPEEDQ